MAAEVVAASSRKSVKTKTERRTNIKGKRIGKILKKERKKGKRRELSNKRRLKERTSSK